jgi:hypothetical protein
VNFAELNLDAYQTLAMAFAFGVFVAALAAYGFWPGRARLGKPNDAPGSEWDFAVQDRVDAQMMAFRSDVRACVDPWAMQAELMDASGQPMPDRPSVTDNSILYAALVLEEGAETAAALATPLASVVREMNETSEAEGVSPENDIAKSLLRAAVAMGNESRYIRSVLGRKPCIEFPLSMEEAAELLDGTTDLAVVNSGLALASGLPGADGYTEVQESNLSKRNPATGIIDKDAGGKWIKGEGYFAPDLRRLLEDREAAR